ncbi:hypothetical protein K9N68_31220 [Kovacikia minuta CCNUW1]|uniref:hypothetical protein n=1 Tax=Kovacikia minuta TaxID=2931930 RepID=UPI001CCFCCAF|nr:hypothetical protein [Kovacikia minuta]UBF25959.1 hypothetical protein K9N68_31220 [Kovacikia minuta CCNUW1]
MRIKKIPVLLFCLVLLLASCFEDGVNGFPTGRVNSVQTIVSDMQPPHEGMPRGVPKDFSWARGPRVGMGNNPKGFRAMTAWGQLYEPAQGNPASNSRVQIRNIKAYLLSKRDRRWHLLQNSKLVQGAAYRQDFAGDANKRADIRYERDGSLSVKTSDGYNFHFWAKGRRASIDPDDVAGIFTTVQARLIVDDPQRPNDLVKARYLLSMGGDYWLDSTAKWNKFSTNGDIGIGKFKYVTPQWQAFNMSTLSPAEIRRNPPPVE